MKTLFSGGYSSQKKSNIITNKIKENPTTNPQLKIVKNTPLMAYY